MCSLDIYTFICKDSWGNYELKTDYLFYIINALIKVIKIIKPYLFKNKIKHFLESSSSIWVRNHHPLM